MGYIPQPQNRVAFGGDELQLLGKKSTAAPFLGQRCGQRQILTQG